MKGFSRLKRAMCFGVLLLMVAGFSGCQTFSYYRQAIQGQYEIVANRESIEKLIADPQTASALKTKLELILRLREFAEQELKLPANGHYLRYAHVDRQYVVWNVHAAPEFTLDPKTWWYPVVGRLKYRGYFSEAAALCYAQTLREQGLDVYVEGVEAYSTLGWFRDPVLSTFIHHGEAGLAEIIFHELAHQRVFAHGDTDFDEAFATAVGEEGVRRWLLAKGDSAAYEKYLAGHRRHLQFVRLVMEARSELEAIYGGQNPPAMGLGNGSRETASDSKLRQKAAVIAKLRGQYAQLKSQWGGPSGYDDWFAQPLNNAQLNTVATYEELVPAFARLLEASGGDLEKFYAEAQRLTKVAKDRRHDQLRELADTSPGTAKQLKLGSATAPAAQVGTAADRENVPTRLSTAE
jgi:predicted aminopeptidase